MYNDCWNINTYGVSKVVLSHMSPMHKVRNSFFRLMFLSEQMTVGSFGRGTTTTVKPNVMSSEGQ